MKKIYAASIFAIILLAGCSQGNSESIELAEQVRPCVERAEENDSISVSVKVALADDGSVMSIEVKGRDANQKMYDATDAVMRAVEKCAPYKVGRRGEFEITLTY